MTTRGAFLFEIESYPGREEPPVSTRVYNHWGCHPANVTGTILSFWKAARKLLAKDTSVSEDVPQVSGAQVMMGLMLAAVHLQFRLVDEMEVGLTGFTYRFVQPTESADSLTMTVSKGDDPAGQLVFTGGYEELKTFWKEMWVNWPGEGAEGAYYPDLPPVPPSKVTRKRVARKRVAPNRQKSRG